MQGQGVRRAGFLPPPAPFADAFSLCLHVASSLCARANRRHLSLCVLIPLRIRTAVILD